MQKISTLQEKKARQTVVLSTVYKYSFDSYYHRYLSQLENDIKEYWISTNAVSDADIDAFYSENQNLFS